MSEQAAASLSNPVLNNPYDEPTRHFELGPGGPTGVIIERRPSEFFIPVPKPKKGRGKNAATQDAFDFSSLTGERVESNDKIDQLRTALRDWRAQSYPGVTPITRKLLLHWADPTREDRVLFAQREAAMARLRRTKSHSANSRNLSRSAALTTRPPE